MALKKPKFFQPTKKDEEELFVFGYSCTLFRDDEKALYLDQGKHLIPWMGNEAIKIDRYDCRGALHDLKRFVPPPGGYDRFHDMTSEEKRIEELCDEERYMALYKDEDEEALYHDENTEKLSFGSEVQFTKNSKATDKIKSYEPNELGTIVAVYQLKENINLFVVGPVDRALFNSIRQHLLIVDRALFVSNELFQAPIAISVVTYSNRNFYLMTLGIWLVVYGKHVCFGRLTASYVANKARFPFRLNLSNLATKPFFHKIYLIWPPTKKLDAIIPRTASFITKQGQKMEIPPTKKLNAIIQRTASFIAKQGRQMEIVLKTKQSGNVQFGFLNFDHPLYPFYQHVIKMVQGGSYETPIEEEMEKGQ
nr:EOG090X07RL [Artemia franciscana]